MKDFGPLKKRIERILDPYDHALILQKGDPELKHEKQKRLIVTDNPPTTETLALRIFGEIETILTGKYKTLQLQSVKLRETDKIAITVKRPL